MTKNIGPKNRAVRAISGIALIIIAVYLFLQNNLPVAIAVGAIGALGLAEALTSYCVLNGILNRKDMR